MLDTGDMKLDDTISQTVPLAGGRDAAGRAPRHAWRPPSSTILLVEDDGTVRRSITQMLTELGHRCVTASDGREALRVLAGRSSDAPIDVVITDLAMPHLDGRALLRDLGQRFPGLPRIVVTALNTEGDAGLRDGPEAADAVLTKPLELTALEAALARVLDHARAR